MAAENSRKRVESVVAADFSQYCMRSTTLVWHRHDLRLADNALYHNLDRCIAVYIFDPTAFARVPSCAQDGWDVTRTGPHSAKLLLAALASLRVSLRALGSDLLVRHGDPASVLPQLALLHEVDEVRWSEEPGSEEVATSLRVQSALRHARCRARTELSCSLYHHRDLPAQQAWASLAHPNQKLRCKRKTRQAPPAQQGREREWRRRLDSQPRVMNDWRRAVRAVASPGEPLPGVSSLCAPELHIDPGGLPAYTPCRLRRAARLYPLSPQAGCPAYPRPRPPQASCRA